MAHRCFGVRSGCVCEGDYLSSVGILWMCGWLSFFHVVGIVGNSKQQLALEVSFVEVFFVGVGGGNFVFCGSMVEESHTW